MKKIVIVIGLGIAALQTYAQVKDSAAYSFSLQQSVDFAMQNQTSIKNSMIDETIAQQKVKELLGAGLPQINSSFDFKDFLAIPTSFIPAEFFGGAPGTFAPIKFGIQYQATAGFDASQLIFSGDYFVGLKASKVLVELSQRSTQRTKIEVSAAVTKAYYMVLISNERINLLDANLVQLKKTMEDTKALFDNGFAEKVDADRLTVSYNNLLVERENVRRLLATGAYLLKYQMGMPMDAKLSLTDKLEDVKFEAASNASAQKFDYSKRIEYNLYDVQFRLAKLDLKRQYFAFLPTASLYGNFSTSAQRNEFDIFNTGKPWYPSAFIGASVKLPIFNGLSRNARTQQAKLSLMKAENNLDNVKLSIDLDLAVSTTTLQNAAATLETQKKNIEIAQDVYRVTKIKFEQGVGSNLEMVTAETTLKEAQTNYYNALYDAIVSKVDFDKANGTLK